jgi:cytochrome bd ubiquinol oxidase subunit II
MLNEIWFGLFVIVICGYLILDGFDMGVGILHMIIAKNDTERRILLNSIGPIWDGNEVWIVLGGGALFAAFPLVYASLFSGFYAAMMLVLLVMILRTCAIEFRSKVANPKWRLVWDVIFSLSSLGLALLLGVAFGNILGGVPIDAQGNMRITLLELLNPFALLVGLTTVAMLTLHGALYLLLRTNGKLQVRVRQVVPKLLLIFTVLIAAVVAVTLAFRQNLVSNYSNNLWPVVLPAAATAALLLTWIMVRRAHDLKAFFASAATIALTVITAAAGLFPNMLLSTTDKAYNLTIYNAASQANTLTVMLVIALVGLPLLLMYQAAAHYIFRGKTELDPHSY